MKINLNIILILLWTCMFIFDRGNLMAQQRNNIDVAIVMDSSGSMKKTDPRSLRIPAAKLFISLLGSSDRAAVLSFSDQGYPIADLMPVKDETNKKKLLNAVDKITSNGLHTNLYGAFNKGMEVLVNAKEEGREQIIVLMSDGMMDVGDTEKDSQLLVKLKSELSGELKKNNIKVYSIAFTDQSDRSMLEKLSKQTGGFYNLALTDRDFHLIFTSIFESLKSPEMLPMEENGFLIDGSIQEVTIVVSKESIGTDVQINAPDGQIYSDKQQYSGVSWFVSDNFDMITVHKPVQGRWEILYSTGENNKAYIITDLQLETNFEQLYAVFGENLEFKVWLEKQGSRIRDGEVLETSDIYIELNDPDGNISNFKPLNNGDGVFQKNIVPFKDGNYRLRVVAKGKTYEREKVYLFNVANLQESKEDLEAAREARKVEKAGEEEQAEGNAEATIHWAKIILQLIFLNLIIGVFIVAYLKRESIKDVKLIINLFKRFRDLKPSPAKNQVHADDHAEADKEAKESAKETVDTTEQIRKAQVALEDEDIEENEMLPGSENEAETEEGDISETDTIGALDTIEEEIQRLEKLSQQEGRAQPADTVERPSNETDMLKAGNEYDGGPSVESAAEKIENMNEAQKSDDTSRQADDLETSPDTEKQELEDTGAEEPLQAEDHEEGDNVEDMWADALTEQIASGNVEEKPVITAEEQPSGNQSLSTSAEESEPVEKEDRKQISADDEKKELTDTSKAESPAEETELAEETQLAMANKTAEQQEKSEISASMPEEIETDTSDNEDGEIEDMWAAALDEQAKEEESVKKTAISESNTSQDVTGLADGNSKKDKDQNLAETMSDDAEAGEEKTSDSKDNPGGSPGASY